MTLVLGWLTSKLAGPIAGALALLFLVFGLVQWSEKKGVEHRVDTLQAQIDNPTTGWRAKLGTCSTNVDRLDAALTSQSAATEAQRAASDRAIAAATKDVAAAQKGQAVADAKVKKLLAPAVGADACIRLLDIDQRVRETLK
jgi:uncharacterized membrane protein